MHVLQEASASPEPHTAVSEESVRAVLAELAREAQYQPPPRELDEAFWMHLMQWLFGARGFGGAAVREGLTWIAYALAAAVAVALAYVIWRTVRQRSGWRRDEAKPPRMARVAKGTALDAFEEAERAWASGDARGATSALYRGAIQNLAARGLVRAEDSKLASTYRAELGARPERSLWDRVVTPFYAAVFGGRTLLRQEFEAARDAAKALSSDRDPDGAP